MFDWVTVALEALGVRGARWQWKKQIWRGQIEAQATMRENLERAGRITTRMCRHCRALVPKQSRTCPECGGILRRFTLPGSGLLEALFPWHAGLSAALVTANFGVLLLVLALWGPVEEAGGLFGLLSVPGPALFVFGAKSAPAIEQGQVWRLVTALFLHGGIMHLLFNSYALMSVGPLIENSFGRRKFFLIYLGSGVVSFLASAWLSPYSLSIGSSGAIFGLFGFAVVYGRFRGGSAGRLIASQLMRCLLLGALMAFLPGIDNYAHLGGGLAGAGMGLVLDTGEPRQRWADALLWALTVAGVVVLVGSFAAMLWSYRANLALLASPIR